MFLEEFLYLLLQIIFLIHFNFLSVMNVFMCLYLQSDISGSEVGVRQTVHWFPRGIRPRPAGWTADSGHAPYG